MMIELTEPERVFLVEVLGIHDDGVVEAQEETLKDHSLDTIEDLLELMDSYQVELRLSNSIRRKLVPCD